MALPKYMFKGHRTFAYIHKNSTKYYGKFMTFKVARSNLDILLSISRKIVQTNLGLQLLSKKSFEKAVDRNKIRKLCKVAINKHSKINSHKPYWLLVNLNLEISAMIK